MKKLVQLSGVAFFLLVWWLIPAAGIVRPFLLPSPVTVFLTAGELLLSGSLFPDLGMTLGRLVVGFLIGVAIGTALGLAMGQWKFADSFFSFIVDFLRSLPVTALIPLFLLLFGIGELSRVGLVIVVCALIMAINARAGVRSIPDALRDVSRVYGIRGRKFFRQVLYPGSLPLVANGIRLALSISLIVVVVVEMFGTTRVGLGRRIIDAQFYFETPELYALILIAGTLGFILNLLFGALERRWIHWAGK